MSKWLDLVKEIQHDLDRLETTGCDTPFFRGHSDSDWMLLCGLGRYQKAEKLKKKTVETVENQLYYDYMSLAGPLLANPNSSWDVLFSMQHHGIPTRLLDWTLIFSAALYFSVERFISSKRFSEYETLRAPCIWMLDPYGLNKSTVGDAVVLNPHKDLMGDYQENFIEKSKDIGAQVLAINPTRTNPRLSAQKSVFTLHSNLVKPLEKYEGRFLKKYVIPNKAIPDAIHFLKLAGLNEFTLFPDLDGLARHLKKGMKRVNSPFSIILN